MTLVGFKARNHVQQTRRRGARPEVDDRQTSPETFDPLNRRFDFTLDVAALPHNAKCERYLTPEDDGLTCPWGGERVWCNPPYTAIEPWLEKAWSEWRSGSRGPKLIVMLLPANRTEQGWWQRHIEPFRDRGRGLDIEFMAGRLRFIAHDDTEIRPNARPPFGCCLAVWS